MGAPQIIAESLEELMNDLNERDAIYAEGFAEGAALASKK